MLDSIRAAAIAALNAVLACVVAFGVDLSTNQVGAILGAANAAFLLALAIEAAWKHTPAPN